MISIVYRELFVLVFPHEFYTAGLCTDLQLVPTSSCMQTMQQLGLRFLPNPTGGSVLARADKAGEPPVYTAKQPLPENARLTFLLRSTRPSFETISETKLDRQADQFYYFNNLGNNIDAEGFPLLVANTTSKKVSDDDLFRLQRGSYGFSHTAAAPQQTGELHSIDTGETVQQQLQNNNDRFNFSFDLAKLASGRTTFFVDGTERDRFYNLPADEGTNFLGLVEVFYRAALAPAFLFLQPSGEITTRQYCIPFGARATRWRYFITRKYNAAVSNVSVQKSNGTVINFSPQAGAPPNQFVLASTAAVPLREQPVTGIQLKDQSNTLLVPHLPNPAFTHLKKEGADLFSDVFITI